jgi:hypothetical protein
VEARDDVRLAYEHVFFGRRVTGNVDPDSAGVHLNTAAPGTPEAIPGETPESAYAEFCRGVWGETLSPESGPGRVHHAPQLEGPVIDGYATPGAPQIEEPTIEAPAIAPPSQGDDLTPGY